MSHWYLVINAILVGMAIALQPIINNQLAKHVQHPLQAALISFCTGTVLLALLCIGMYVFRQTPFPETAKLLQGPWWMWLGGSLGVLFITASICIVTPLGPTTMLMCFIAGQLTASMVIEHFGLLNLPVQPISLQRLFAVFLMAVAIVLIAAPGWKGMVDR